MNVHAYVLDGGLWKDDPEFGGRATNDFDAASGVNFDASINNNPHGHEVASVIGGVVAGVAKSVRIHSLKVTDRNGELKLDGIVRACEWLLTHYRRPALVNISISGSRPQGEGPADNAIKRLLGRSICVVASAGNRGEDAGQYYPGAINEVINVGASSYAAVSATEFRANFSNFGSKVDLFAPGYEVLVRSFRAPQGQRQSLSSPASGTSFAAPYVAGAIAKHLQRFPLHSPSDIQAWLNTTATQGALDPVTLNGSPNRLVYSAE